MRQRLAGGLLNRCMRVRIHSGLTKHRLDTILLLWYPLQVNDVDGPPSGVATGGRREVTTKGRRRNE